MVAISKPVKTETQVTRECLHYLMNRSDILTWRSNSGAVKIDDQLVRFGISGQADWTGIIKVNGYGIRLEIEFKRPGGKQSENQKNFERNVVGMGGIYVLAHSVESLVKGIQDGVDRLTAPLFNSGN